MWLKRKQVIAIFLSLFLSPPVIAADLKAPVEHKMTVGSEMHRGSNIVFDCAAPLYKGGPLAPWADFLDCIHKTTNDEIGKNTFTEPFQLGLYSGAYMHLRINRDIELKFRHHDLHSDKIFADHEELYFHKTQYLKHTLGLSDDDICKGIADDEHRPTATCSVAQRAMLADPAITPFVLKSNQGLPLPVIFGRHRARVALSSREFGVRPYPYYQCG
jgi:hypothetical protein